MIANSLSTHFNTIKDIFIKDGSIHSIGENISEAADTTIDAANLIASPGWVDVFANFADPGFENKETLETGAAAAIAGGFTQVFVLPNTQPVIDKKTQVNYIVQQTKHLPATIRPLGAISKLCEGKELAEMYDMYQSVLLLLQTGCSRYNLPE